LEIKTPGDAVHMNVPGTEHIDDGVVIGGARLGEHVTEQRSEEDEGPLGGFHRAGGLHRRLAGGLGFRGGLHGLSGGLGGHQGILRKLKSRLTITAPVAKKPRVTTMDILLPCGMPMRLWPLTQPPAQRAPKPTRNPLKSSQRSLKGR